MKRRRAPRGFTGKVSGPFTLTVVNGLVVKATKRKADF